MPIKEILLVGAGGHCRSCIDVLESLGDFSIMGIVGSQNEVGKEVLGYPVLGTDADLADFVPRVRNVLLCLGQLAFPLARIRLHQQLTTLGAVLPVIISPKAYLSKHATVGPGSIVMHHAVVNAGARVGSGCIINTASLIEHDVIVDEHCHVATRTVVNGGVHVGARTLLGSNATVLQGIRIPPDSIVGAGAVMTKSFAESGVFVGNPARKVTSRVQR